MFIGKTENYKNTLNNWKWARNVEVLYFSWVRVINLFFPSGSCFIATTLTAPDINILLNLKIIGAKQKIKFVLFARLLIWLLILEYNLFSFKLAFRQNLITVPQIWWKKRIEIYKLFPLRRQYSTSGIPTYISYNQKLVLRVIFIDFMPTSSN